MNFRRVLLVRPKSSILQNQNWKFELQTSRVRVFPKFIIEAQLNKLQTIYYYIKPIYFLAPKSKFCTFTCSFILEKKQSAIASLLHRVNN